MSKRTKFILKSTIPIVGVALVILALSMLANAPGFIGEVFAKLVGIMFTPIFLELSIGFLGFVALFWVNKVRADLDGDEYVEMEIEEDE